MSANRVKIEFVGKHVDDPNGIVPADPVFQTSRKQRALNAICPLNEAPHLIPPRKSHGNHIARIKSSDAFSHSLGPRRTWRALIAMSALPPKADIRSKSSKGE